MTVEPLVLEARVALHAHVGSSGRATRYRLHGVDSLLKLPDVRWIVDGWISHGGYSVFYGPPGVGKTAVLLNLAVAVAAGHPWMGRPVEQAGVLFVAAEGLAGFNRRLTAALDECEIAPRQRRLLPLRVIDAAPDLTQAESLAGIVRAAARIPNGCGLIIVDPLVECMSGEENGEGMQLASDGARFLARQTGAAVVIGHHTDAKGLTERGNKRLRARALAMVKASSAGDVRTLTVDKQRHGREFELQFVLQEQSGSIVTRLVPESEHVRGTRPRTGVAAMRSSVPSAETIITDTLRNIGPCSSSALMKASKSRGRGDDVLRAALRLMVDGGVVLRRVEGRRHVLSLKDPG